MLERRSGCNQSHKGSADAIMMRRSKNRIEEQILIRLSLDSWNHQALRSYLWLCCHDPRLTNQKRAFSLQYQRLQPTGRLPGDNAKVSFECTLTNKSQNSSAFPKLIPAHPQQNHHKAARNHTCWWQRHALGTVDHSRKQTAHASL